MEQLSFAQTYKDLCSEIEMLKIRINDLELERKHLCKSMFSSAPKFRGVVDYSKDAVMGGGNATSLDRIVERINKIDEELSTLNRILEAKEKARLKMEGVLESFDGLEYKIAHLKAKGLKLHEIADRLGYSYSWIRQVASKKKNEQRANKKVENL